MTTIYEMTDVELAEFLTVYEAGEILSTEAEIDYVMARLPDFFRGRPKLINYSYTDKDREIFKKIREGIVANGRDLDGDEF